MDHQFGQVVLLAVLLCHLDVAPAGQRERVLAVGIPRTADQPRPAPQVLDGEFAILGLTAVRALADDLVLALVGLVGLALWTPVDERIAAGEHLHVFQAVFLARLVEDERFARTRERERVPTVREAVTADEVRAVTALANQEVVVALGTGAERPVGLQRLLQEVADLLVGRLQVLEDPFEHLAGLVGHFFQRRLAVGDGRHVPFEFGGHLLADDVVGELLRRLDDRLRQCRRLWRVVLDVAAVVELLDHVVAGRLRADPHLLHLLDEPRLPVPPGRLGLLGLEFHVRDRQVLALLHVGHEVLARAGVGIDRVVARFHEALAVRLQLTAVGLGDDAEVGPRRGLGDGREEATDDEFVDLPLVLVQFRAVREFAGRVDRRVVGRLLVTLGGFDVRQVEQRLGVLAERPVAGEGVEQFVGFQVVGVDRVVRPRIRDVAGGVEFLGETHRPLGGVTERTRGGDELGRVERRGRRVRPGTPADLRDRRRLRLQERLVCLVGAFLVPDPLGLAPVVVVEVLGLEGFLTLVEVREQFPVVLGVERLDLALAVDDELQRRGLHPADGDEIVSELPRREGEIPGQRRAPHEVDDLSGLASGREVEVDVVRVREGVAHLALGDRREADPLDRHVRLVADDLVGFLPDEFALAVVVRGDDRLLGHAGEFPERGDDVLFRRRLRDLGVDEFDGFDVPPVVVFGREVDAHDVAREADDAFLPPAVDVDAVLPVDLGGVLAEDVGDAPRGVVLLGDDQLHVGPPPGTQVLIAPL